MVRLRYQVDWQPNPGAVYPVSLMLESEMVALAIKGGGVKETPSRLELCRRVREAAALTHPHVYMETIIFEHLTIAQLS